ncbi:MAG: tetratricopeptide repeat protein [Candidatus Omnitrophota bacterium]
MKKTLLIFAVILGGVFLVLSILDYRGDYNAEKIIWQTNQKLDRAVRSPEAVPDKTYEEIAASYQKVIDRFSKSNLAKSAYILLGKTYATKKDYEKAREIFDTTCATYPEDKGICSQAMLLVGKTYELQGNWDQAKIVYDIIVQKFPLTDGGLTIPLYIAKYYNGHDQKREAAQAYAQAITHYSKLSAEHPNSMTDFKVLGLLSNAYIDTEQWREAVGTLSASLLKYPHPNTAESIFKSINLIALAKLQDKDLAIKVYRDILNQRPDHPLASLIKEMIKSVQTLKAADLDVRIKE